MSTRSLSLSAGEGRWIRARPSLSLARAHARPEFGVEPYHRLEAVERFYREGLGLVELERFDDHCGYSGVMFGLPGKDHHLEFTTHVGGSPASPRAAKSARPSTSARPPRRRLSPIVSPRSVTVRSRRRTPTGRRWEGSRSRTPMAGGWCWSRLPSSERTVQISRICATGRRSRRGGADRAQAECSTAPRRRPCQRPPCPAPEKAAWSVRVLIRNLAGIDRDPEQASAHGSPGGGRAARRRSAGPPARRRGPGQAPVLERAAGERASRRRVSPAPTRAPAAIDRWNAAVGVACPRRHPPRSGRNGLRLASCDP